MDDGVRQGTPDEEGRQNERLPGEKAGSCAAAAGSSWLESFDVSASLYRAAGEYSGRCGRPSNG